MSPPSRERGLKYLHLPSALHKPLVAPLEGAWIEIGDGGKILVEQGKSLPSRERGLKSPIIPINGLLICRRSPRGSVD